jgi:predicted Zn-dependent peptidase
MVAGRRCDHKKDRGGDFDLRAVIGRRARPCYRAGVMDEAPSAARPRARLRLQRVIRALVVALGAASALALSLPASAAPGAKKPAAGKKAAKAGAAKGGGKGTGKGDGTGKKAGKSPAVTPAAAPAAKTAATVAAQPGEVAVALQIQRVTLENGLRVVLNPDHTSPTIAVAVAYDVGSRNEEHGKSGFAHLFEHMMFQGSKNVEKGGHFRLISAHGGQLNGTTNSDRTNYFEMLPENELALGLFLEADRMKSLDISEANFENQRKVVQEEYRMRVSNSAYAPSEIRLEELVYQGYWPYEHSTIGSMADLDAAKLDQVGDFFAHHYGPNNAVLSIAGDFDPAQALVLVHRYFDSAAKITATPFEAVVFPEQTSQRTAVVKDDNARTPGLFYGWAIPANRTADHYALEVAAYLLGQGESSRLNQLLVRDKELALSATAGTDDRRGPDLFSISLKLADGKKTADVANLVETEVKNLSTRGPSDAEIEKARRQIQTGLVVGIQSNGARARKLADYELFSGDATQFNGELAKYLAVTKDDVKRVVTTYLGPTRRSIVETYPAESAAKDPGAAKAAAVTPAGAAAAAAPTPKAAHAAAAPKGKKGAAKDAKAKKPASSSKKK